MLKKLGFSENFPTFFLRDFLANVFPTPPFLNIMGLKSFKFLEFLKNIKNSSKEAKACRFLVRPFLIRVVNICRVKKGGCGKHISQKLTYEKCGKIFRRSQFLEQVARFYLNKLLNTHNWDVLFRWKFLWYVKIGFHLM